MRQAFAVALLLLALVACNGDTTPAYRSCAEVSKAGAAPLHKGDPGYTSKLDRDGDGTACDTTGPSSTESTLQPVAAQTITACRALADNQRLADYWKRVADGTSDASARVAAANAIRGLEVYLPMPDVDPSVVAAVKAATDAIAADGALPVRPDEFKAIVTPIVDACRALDIDMTVK